MWCLVSWTLPDTCHWELVGKPMQPLFSACWSLTGVITDVKANEMRQGREVLVVCYSLQLGSTMDSLLCEMWILCNSCQGCCNLLRVWRLLEDSEIGTSIYLLINTVFWKDAQKHLLLSSCVSCHASAPVDDSVSFHHVSMLFTFS